MSGHRASPANLSQGEIFTLLADPRRREALRYLDRAGGTATLGEMAAAVAARENDVDACDLTAAQRKRVYTSLQQTHLGKLDDAGVVDFDRERGEVRATAALETVEVYLEVVPGREFPWREYYLALGAVASALTVVVWLDLGPFAHVPDLAAAAFVATALTASAAVHGLLERRAPVGRASEGDD